MELYMWNCLGAPESKRGTDCILGTYNGNYVAKTFVTCIHTTGAKHAHLQGGEYKRVAELRRQGSQMGGWLLVNVRMHVCL